MWKLIVNGKNGREESDFATQAEAQAHFEAVRLTGHWGAEEQVIEHPEIPAVIVEHPEVPAVTVEHPEVPEVLAQDAVLDEEGNVVTPAIEAVAAIPAWTEVISEAIPAWTEVISEAVPAWTETIPCQYTYEIVEFNQIPAPISRKQLKLALLDIGVTEEMIDASINTLPSPAKEQAMIQWKDSSDFKFDHPLVAPLAAALGFNDEQIRSVWVNGASKE